MPVTASHVLLVRPALFGYNAETAGSNSFQNSVVSNDTHAAALREFDAFTEILNSNKIGLTVYQSGDLDAPDALFPNNWFASMPDGQLFLFPMMAPNRRRERSPKAISFLHEKFDFNDTIDLSVSESVGRFLEGTGSIVFEHRKRIAFAAISPRTDRGLFEDLCQMTGYHPVIFNSVDAGGLPVYHTNVVLHIGNQYALFCAESLPDTHEQKMVTACLHDCGLEVVTFTRNQMDQYCGNMLQVLTINGDPVTLCSKQAFLALNTQQRMSIEKYSRFVVADIPTIETVGGGSLRCMLAEIYAPEKK